MRVLFVGPSLYGDFNALRADAPGLDIRAPAGRGDIRAAVLDGAEAIGLVDGFFGDVPAVWHKEILFALEKRIPVGGGASMGALRAAECCAFGMTGIGGIFRDYRDGVVLDDEAVALAHAPSPMGWMPLSVPWVNFAATVERARSEAAIREAEADLLFLAGRHLHFTERTFAAAARLCSALPPERQARVAELLKAGMVDRKKADAWSVARWLARVATPATAPRWELARTSHWLALERGGVRDEAVPDRAASMEIEA